MDILECPYCGYKYDSDEIEGILDKCPQEYCSNSILIKDDRQCTKCDKWLRFEKEITIDYDISDEEWNRKSEYCPNCGYYYDVEEIEEILEDGHKAHTYCDGCDKCLTFEKTEHVLYDISKACEEETEEIIEKKL